MQVRTTAYKVDTLNDFRSRMTGKKEKAVNIRTHFAVSFTKGIGEKDADRKKSVRKRNPRFLVFTSNKVVK